MTKLRSNAYRGFVPTKELPFVAGDMVAIRAGTTIYVCDEAGEILGNFVLSTEWMVTIELIINGEEKMSPGNGDPDEDYLHPRFGWKDDDLWLQVRFQELFEQGSIPPRKNYI